MRRDLSVVRLALGVAVGVSVLACQADKYADLEQWIIDNGGWVNTTIKTRENGVRGLFMKVAAESGAHVATISASCMINAGSLTSSILAGTLTVLRELKDPHSRFKPYIAVWPKPDEVVNVCNFPQKYLHMLPDHWQKMTNVTQEYLHAALKGEINHDLEFTVKETVGTIPITIEDLQYACALSSTRYVTEERRKRLMMIPIFDMENHVRDCPHSITSLEDGETISIVLGDDVQAGDELCYPYTDTMRDDYGVMNYGFLPDLEDPPRLFEVDHHQFKPDGDQQELTETPFEGNEEELAAEITRHQQTLDSLELLDAARLPGPEAGADWIYDMLVEMQRRRKEAITYEISRLHAALSNLRGSQTDPVEVEEG